MPNSLERTDNLVTAVDQHRRDAADLGTALTGWQRRHLPGAVAAVRLGPIIAGKLSLATGCPGLTGHHPASAAGVSVLARR